MKEFIDNVGTWIGDIWDTFNAFIRDNHSNPFLWLGIIVVGLAIAMWAFNYLSKDSM